MSKRECKTKIPFTDRLDAIPLPRGFTLPQFTLFNGTGEPIKHLQGFLAKMTSTSNDPDIYAKVFSNSLRTSFEGPLQLLRYVTYAKTFSNNLANRALNWYMALPLRSIDSYEQTADAFIAKFGSAIQAHQDEQGLMDIHQGTNESLRSYHKRYNDILLTIPEVNNKIGYMTFYRGLMYGKLKKALILKKTLSKDELTAREPSPRQSPRIKPEPHEVPRITGHIDTIFGGIIGGGDSQNSRKNYARREVYCLN
ncbi:hypothetical protein LIER_38599 [Lithospermum erythrorhizon]|uniref:Retrotransposon gag domain-containing protein n=1 Tax=Lithospermum erythrorhizon TaxID=34254 RepID=A0AAV3Q4K4_LITER